MRELVLKNSPDVIIVSQFIRSDSPQANLRNALVKLKSMVPNMLIVGKNPIFLDWLDFMTPRPILMSPYNPPKSFSMSAMDIRDRKASDQLAS